MLFETRALFQKFGVLGDPLVLKLKDGRLEDTLDWLLLVVGKKAGS